MLQIPTWDENYITSHGQLDNYHREIIQLLSENFVFITTPDKNLEKINESSQKFVSLMLEHIELESYLIAKYNIENYKKHIVSHNEIKDRIEAMKKYDIPILISTITISSIICEYFSDHFFAYDKVQLPLLKEKINEQK